jgi:glycosyltransferase involved in cell wall biosynthesis
MRLVIATEERLACDPDGVVWTSAQGHYGFWQRYLAAFDEVAIAARVQRVGHAEVCGKRASGDGVTVVPIPYYLGPWQYARRYFRVREALHAAVSADDAVLLRLPAQIATTMAPSIYRSGRPYGVEVVGDPYDVFAPGAVTHPLRPYFRRSYTRAQRQQVSRAAAVSYVTSETLQRRYPANPGAYTTHYSSVELPEEAFVNTPRRILAGEEQLRLVTVGSFAHMYKGIDILLRAVARLHERGLPVSLRVIGEGRHKAEMEALAGQLGVGASVAFLGQLPSSEAVRGELDRADLFVMASRTEGLPRSMIEAMARGIPCVGTHVGGIPELLDDAFLVPAEDASALADKVIELAVLPETRRVAALRNLEVARSYASAVLGERRNAFYGYLREVTERWLKTRSEHGSSTC